MGEKKIEPVVTRKEIASLLGLSVETIDRMAKSGGLPYYKLGDSVRFRISEVERWLKERRHVNV